MMRSLIRTQFLIAASLVASGTAAAQGGGAGVSQPAPPGATPPAATLPPPPGAVADRPAGAVPATVPAPPVTRDLRGALGFGIGVIPNAELVGSSGAVALKVWLSDSLAIAPLFSFGYTAPKGTDNSWHLRPEFVVLFSPFKSASTRLELGGGLGFALNKPPPVMVIPGGAAESTNTTFDVTIPIQAGVEHFFAPWFSMGIAARTALIEYTEDGDFHQISFAIDSTSLLGQLFFYTD